jgi:protease I
LSPATTALKTENIMKLKGKRILCLVEDIYEDLELWYPKLRLEEEGAEVVVAGPEKKTYKGKHGYPCAADATLASVKAESFDGLHLAGGFAPDQLRRRPEVLSLVQQFHESRKPIAFICHAGWIPISAKVVRGIRCTSTPAIKDDLINAGAEWVDEECVVSGHFVTSRKPADLPAYCQAFIRLLAGDGAKAAR